ncbi:MAG: fasciclin domain-containing protein, partial [Cryomorphaceae bacterium]
MKTKFTLLALLAFFVSVTGFSQQTQVAGSLSALSGYEAGATVEIPFNIDFTNLDDEYVDLLELTFPAGVTIEGVSNDDVFTDNDLVFGPGAVPNAEYNGINGQTVSWGDDNNSFGGIVTAATIGGELVGLSYDFTVTITVDAGTTGDLTVDFLASGDTYDVNAPAGDLSGSITIGEGVSVYGIVVNSPDHTVLEQAINTAGLQFALAGDIDPVTLFAPTDAAFTTFLTDNGLTAEELLADPELANILLYHALGLSAPSSGLTDGQVVETLLTGESVTIGVVADPFAVTVNGENVSTPDLAGSNGIVHVIDGVLTPPPPVAIPLDFELDPASYDIIGFGGAQNTSVIPNPDPSGANTSANVWQQTQDAANTTEFFAGAVVTLDEPIPFDEAPLMAMEVWTPVVGDEVTLKIEDGNGAEFEQVVTSTVAGEWETMVFDFTGQFDLAIDYTRVVVFFNNGSANVAETYYADNIRMEIAPTIFDIVEASDDHNTLETALIESGLNGVTSDPEADLTLFAPTDAAFD